MRLMFLVGALTRQGRECANAEITKAITMMRATAYALASAVALDLRSERHSHAAS